METIMILLGSRISEFDKSVQSLSSALVNRRRIKPRHGSLNKSRPPLNWVTRARAFSIFKFDSAKQWQSRGSYTKNVVCAEGRGKGFFRNDPFVKNYTSGATRTFHGDTTITEIDVNREITAKKTLYIYKIRCENFIRRISSHQYLLPPATYYELFDFRTSSIENIKKICSGHPRVRHSHIKSNHRRNRVFSTGTSSPGYKTFYTIRIHFKYSYNSFFSADQMVVGRWGFMRR